MREQETLRPRLVAEIGINHNGSIDQAKRLIEAAASSGADVVKFQTYSSEQLVAKSAEKVLYQIENDGASRTHFEMLKDLELSFSDTEKLKDFCDGIGIEFSSTPYDPDSLRFLISLGLRFIKISSADVVDPRLHRIARESEVDIVISTGMASLGEIEKTLSLYSGDAINRVSLLHAVSDYPCAMEDMNLRNITTLANAFHVPVGLSDHGTDTIISSVLAVSLNAFMYERHFTLDKGLPGPDHIASSDPAEFSEIAEAMSTAAVMLGRARRQTIAREAPMKKISRKSWTYSAPLQAGAPLASEQASFLRPGAGLPFDDLTLVIGKTLRRNVVLGDPIRLEDFLS